ncbi:MAG: hypothetical protein KC713_01445, partial [Candidatus Omnitrophica bacterium]|nr:hypothetical protein [Candidatus Omnitrophota bacterium]
QKKYLAGSVFTLLALSATASIFQLGTMGVAWLMIQLTEKNFLRRIIKQGLQLFGPAVLISLFYCLKVKQWGYEQTPEEWRQFFILWKHKSQMIPMMVSASVLAFCKSGGRRYAVVPMSFLFLFLLGPVLFQLTKMKGFFYTERQYLYYDLTFPLFILTMFKSLSVYVQDKTRGKAALIMVLTVVMCLTMTFRKKPFKKFISCVKLVRVGDNCRSVAVPHRVI